MGARQAIHVSHPKILRIHTAMVNEEWELFSALSIAALPGLLAAV
jgi:hypothetical protein